MPRSRGSESFSRKRRRGRCQCCHLVVNFFNLKSRLNLNFKLNRDRVT